MTVGSIAVDMQEGRLKDGRLSGIYEPRVMVTINSGTAVPAIVDTGSPYTIANWGMAEDAFIEEEKLKTENNWVGLSGFREDDRITDGYRYRCKLSVSRGGQVLVVESWVVFSVEQVAAGELILGQYDFLEQLTLTHANHPPAPTFVLEYPR